VSTLQDGFDTASQAHEAAAWSLEGEFVMRPPTANKRRAPIGAAIWDILTFDRLLTGPVIHLMYWAGLGVIALLGFFVLGASIGMALREESWLGLLLAVPIAVAGLLVIAALALLWRGVCEFYVAVFRISDDLRALRRADEALHSKPPTG
jgi:hypothetical protein